MPTTPATARFALLIGAALLAGACGSRREPAPVVFRSPGGGFSSSGVAAAPAPSVAAAPLGGPTASPVAAGSPDDRGIVDYGGYAAIVARPGDTIDSLAARAGIAASSLAAYNGLPADHRPRSGDELILPPAPSGAPAAVAAAVPPPTSGLPPVTGTGLDGGAVDAGVARAVSAPVPPPSPGFDLARIEAAIGGAPAPAVAPAAPVAEAPPLAAGPDAPAAGDAAALAAGAVAAAAATDAPAAPAAPIPEPAAAPAPVAPPAAPAVAAAPPAARFAQPVAGSVTKPFSREAGARSDGVAYAAPAGEPVRAAADGQVALVSESLGGDLGTVVLIRHEGQILTVYGRVGDVKVAKGDRVIKGEVIGAVAPGKAGGDPSLHFEVRRGTEPVDPAQFF
jgi:murein DD-endopeptidase MepM/ murein hydrolase activator NlpD